MTDEVLSLEGLRTWSKTRLAETIQAQAAMLALVQREKAAAEWQAGLLAAQRDAVLKYLAAAPARDVCGHFDPIYQILITDPGDAP